MNIREWTDRWGLAERATATLIGVWLTLLVPAFLLVPGAPTLMLALALLASTLTGLVILGVLRAKVSRPLRDLESFSQRLRAGDLGQRPPEVEAPEIRALARSLHEMATEVERAHQVLEDRVQSRTTELSAALAQLQRADTERQAALSRLQSIVDQMADGVIFVDDQNHIALVNRAGRALKGLREEGGALEACHPAESHEMMYRVLGWLRDGDDTGPPHPIIKEKEGRWETTYAPVRDEDGTYQGTVMVIRDISERRNLERRLLDSERLAAVGRMSAQVAHELRNPLNTIDGAAQYLQRRLPDDPDVTEYVGLIAAEVQRVNHFIDDLLHIARPAAPQFGPADINAIARDARTRATVSRRVPVDTIRLDLQDGLPSLELDHKLVMEAVVNLAANALDATGTEAPTITTRFEQTGGSGQVVLEVVDRGTGLDPDQLDELQRPFVTTKADGTGLGLVIVARAMTQHRGSFELRNREGGGACARLGFPIRTARPEPEEPQP